MEIDVNYAMQFETLREFVEHCEGLWEKRLIQRMGTQQILQGQEGYSDFFVEVDGRTFGSELWNTHREEILEIANNMTVDQRQLFRTRNGFIEIHGVQPETPVTEETFENQIEKQAEYLFKLLYEGDDWVGGWPVLNSRVKEKYLRAARYMSTPKTDIQSELKAALESERELIGYLREIGKVFGRNVGVDIGIQDLPKLVEKEHKSVQNELKESSSKIHKLTCTLMNSKHLNFDLNGNSIDESIKFLEIYDTLIGHVEMISKGEHLEHSSVDTHHALVGYINHLWNEAHPPKPVPSTPEDQRTRTVERILGDSQLHDLITHLGDFETACKSVLSVHQVSGDNDDVMYWQKQVNTVKKLREITGK